MILLFNTIRLVFIADNHTPSPTKTHLKTFYFFIQHNFVTIYDYKRQVKGINELILKIGEWLG